MTAMLIPERFLVQPQVVPMHAAEDPDRKYLPSQIALRNAKSVTAMHAAANLIGGRWEAMSMKELTERERRVMQFILLHGDRRYWSWSARRSNAKGKVRYSLREELSMDKDNLNRVVRGLLACDVVGVRPDQQGKEVIYCTDTFKMLAAEVAWRWKLHHAIPEIHAMASMYGWQELSIQIDRRMMVEELDFDRRADLVLAAKTQFEEGVEQPDTVILRKRNG